MENKVYNPENVLSPVHLNILSAIKPGSRVLEVGSASGYMTHELSQELNCEVTAVEISPSAAQQSSQWANTQIIGDITKADTREQIIGRFDSILFCDVLEHLADPWETLRWCKDKLNNGGQVLASLPNIAHYKIRLKLLMGEFDYEPFGILDDSHLRFFTCKSAKELFQKSGYEITAFEGVCQGINEDRIKKYLPCLVSYQFVIHSIISKANDIENPSAAE